MKRIWVHQVFIAVDQLVNAILAGWADETLSARSFRLGRRDELTGRWGRWRISWIAIDWLFWPQDAWLATTTGSWPQIKHCERAFINEYNRTQMPAEYRQ